MKTAFLFVGLILGFGIYAFVDLRKDYFRSKELAVATCKILVLSDPNVRLLPAEIDCKIINVDYQISFAVNEKEGVFLECLPGALTFGEIILGQCKLSE